jgi:cold-inducible RNA-binding protein
MRLFVSNIDYLTGAEDLREWFETHGYSAQPGDGVKIIKDRDTGQSRGFGFVELGDHLDGEKAIKDLDGQLLDGRRLNIREAVGPKPTGRGRGGNGRG